MCGFLVHGCSGSVATAVSAFVCEFVCVHLESTCVEPICPGSRGTATCTTSAPPLPPAQWAGQRCGASTSSTVGAMHDLLLLLWLLLLYEWGLCACCCHMYMCVPGQTCVTSASTVTDVVGSFALAATSGTTLWHCVWWPWLKQQRVQLWWLLEASVRLLLCLWQQRSV